MGLRRTAFLPFAIGRVLDAEGALAAGYRDLTERFVFTIDPADAKDFDDALSLDYLTRSARYTLVARRRASKSTDEFHGT